MGVVFFGSTKLGFSCCSSLIKNGVEISAIFTIPENFSIKYKNDAVVRKVKNATYEDFTFFKNKYNIPVFFVENNILEYKTYIESLEPELILVIGWYYFIDERILNIPYLGSCALHASLLPKYRGNAPLVWAMINGEKETGVSLFYLAKGIDDGDIIAQKSFVIDNNDTIREVLNKTEDASIEIVINNIPKILNKTANRIPQNHSNATYYPKRTPEDGNINWNLDSESILRFIRAQTHPYPGAYTYINGKKVIIWEASIINEQ